MENIQEQINEQKTMQSTKKKRTILWLLLPFVLLFFVGGFFAFHYLNPSDKELLMLAHYHSLQDREKQKGAPDVFYKETDVSCKLEGGFVDPKTIENFSRMSIHSENARLAEGNGFFRFAFRIGERDVLTTESISYAGENYVASKELTDGQFYSGKTPQEVLNFLLGGQNIHTDVNILDGVEKEVLSTYLTHYGKNLYSSLPESAFSREKTESGKIVTLSGSAAWLLTDVVANIKEDYGLKNFLYLQRETIAENLSTMYPGASVLLPSMSQAEFEQVFDKALSGFLTDIAEKKTTLTLITKIDGNRRVISDSLTLKNGETPVFDFYYHTNGSYRFVPYKDGVPMYAMENVQKTDETVTDAVFTFSMDVNELSKSPSETMRKMFHLTVASRKNTNTSAYSAKAPDGAKSLQNMTNEEYKEAEEKADNRLSDVLMEIILNAVVTD